MNNILLNIISRFDVTILFFAFLIFIYYNFNTPLCAESKKLSAKEVIENYLNAVGGDSIWKNLKSRVSMESVTYYKNSDMNIYQQIQTKRSTKTHYFKSPNLYLWNETDKNSEKIIVSENPKFAWVYSDNARMQYCFELKTPQFKHEYPKIGLLEFLNLKMINKTRKEDGLICIDFEDDTKLDGIQTLYFNPKTFLAVKRSYIDKNGVTWELKYAMYQKKNGFSEPYNTSIFQNGKLFLDISTFTIDYHQKIEEALFNPPIECNDVPSTTRLEKPYEFDY